MNFQDPAPPPASLTRPIMERAKSKRAAVMTGIGAVVVLAGLYAFHAVREHFAEVAMASRVPPPAAVTTEVVQPTTMPHYLAASGSITAVHNVTLSPEVEGRVVKIMFEPGAEVKKGDLLVQLNDAPDRAELASMRAKQRLAEVALDRARRLTEGGYVSRAQLDQAQSQYDAAVAGADKAQAMIAQKSIRAPFSGVLGMRWAEVGQYLNAGTAITTLTEMSPLYITFTLPEQTRPHLAVGQKVELTVDAYPGRAFPARVAVIDPQIMVDTRTVRLQAVSENEGHLLSPGMFAKVQLTLPAREDVLTVMETAVDHSLYGDTVFVVKEQKDASGATVDKVTRVPVQTGERVNGRVIISGVKAGDRVVTTGQVHLFEGATVTITKGSMPPAPTDTSYN
jgi:multidrug efflux system membrane fusion protein